MPPNAVAARGERQSFTRHPPPRDRIRKRSATSPNTPELAAISRSADGGDVWSKTSVVPRFFIAQVGMKLAATANCPGPLRWRRMTAMQSNQWVKQPIDEFPSTRWSLVLAVGGSHSADSDRALASLCQAYWYPVYAYIRRRRSSEDAQDLTQEFFVQVLERDLFVKADATRGRFRVISADGGQTFPD